MSLELEIFNTLSKTSKSNLMPGKMTVAYVTHYNAHEVINWSGLGYYIWKALYSAGATIEFIGDLSDKQSYLVKTLKKWEYVFEKNSRWFMVQQNETVAKNYANQIAERLQGLHPDCIFSPSSFPVAYLETDLPKIFYTDSTFHRMLDYYKSFKNLTPKCIERGHKIEKKALDSCSLAIYSSEWAAESAIKFYGTNPSKVRVVPFGSNIENIPDDRTVYQVIERKLYEPLNILFVGVDWERKGGDIVIETCLELEKRGIPFTANIVGVESVPYANLPASVKV
ncbi:MAG: glycosyl transferase group 1, partial [Segetibacter sp.]|nr:glycosyl transferase group 1 [Segetibacter sp.]